MSDISASLKTERLVLQPVSAGHAHGLHSAVIASRAELLPWMPWALDPTAEANRLYTEEAALAAKEGREYHFALVDRASGLVLGVAGVNREDDPGTFELHYWMRSDHTGLGLTTEACRALLKWAEEVLGATRFSLWAGSANVASRRVAEKLGFIDIGPLGWKPEGGLGTFSAQSFELSVGDSAPPT